MKKSLSAAGYFLGFFCGIAGDWEKEKPQMLYMFSTWRSIPFSKWLVIMVRFRPQDLGQRGAPSKISPKNGGLMIRGES